MPPRPTWVLDKAIHPCRYPRKEGEDRRSSAKSMSYGFGSTGERFEQKERHSKEDALSAHQFELLYESAARLPDEYYALQCMWVVMVAGRLGLRRSEISHMTEQWVDWDDKMIRIPRHQNCECGSCKQYARQKVEYSSNGLTLEEAISHRWHPKTESAVREVPFGFSPRVEVIMKRFFDKYDEYPHAGTSVNRRVKRVLDNCDEIDNLYPHALRATAATYHAGRGLGVTPLQSLMGWADLETPMRYVKASGKNTARELSTIHNR